LFFLAVFAWLSVLLSILIGSGVVIPIVAIVTAVRHRALRTSLQTMGLPVSPRT
jgi:hypothetical protein